jgi:hypothetical protein
VTVNKTSHITVPPNRTGNPVQIALCKKVKSKSFGSFREGTGKCPNLFQHSIVNRNNEEIQIRGIIEHVFITKLKVLLDIVSLFLTLLV